MKCSNNWFLIFIILGGALCLHACGGATGEEDPTDDPDGEETPSSEYNIGVSLTGLEGSNDVTFRLRLFVDGEFHNESEVSSGNATFTFPITAPDGAEYSVYVVDHPDEPMQRCDANHDNTHEDRTATGAVTGADVSLNFSCVPAYRVSLNVTGLEEERALHISHRVHGYAVHDPIGSFTNLPDITENGQHEVTYPHKAGEIVDLYQVFGTPPQTATEQRCRFFLDDTEYDNFIELTMPAEDVELDVVCDQRFPLRVSVSGYENGPLTLRNTITNPNGSSTQYPKTELLPIPGDTETEFTQRLVSGDSYVVDFIEQPVNPEEACRIRDNTGNGDVSDTVPPAVLIECGAVYVGGAVQGLYGSGLVLDLAVAYDDSGTIRWLVIDDIEIEEDGEFQFESPVGIGDEYRVTVATPPSNPAQECEIENGEGVAEEDVDNVLVECPGPVRVVTFSNFRDEFQQDFLDEYGEIYEQYKFTEDRDSPLLSLVSGLSDTPLFQNIVDQPGTDGAIYSSANGQTYWTLIESTTGQAPNLPDRLEKPYYHFSNLTTVWGFRKETVNAAFSLEISKAEMVAYDAGHEQFIDLDEYSTLTAEAHIKVSVYDITEYYTRLVPVPYNSTAGSIKLRGKVDPNDPGLPAIWEVYTWVDHQADTLVWTEDDFDLNPAAGVELSQPEQVATLKLNKNITIDLDLSDVPIGSTFIIESEAETAAQNLFTEEGASAAYFRDPAEFLQDEDGANSGLNIVDMSDLTIVSIDPEELPPSIGTPTPPDCSLSDPQPAIIEFSASSYELPETQERPPRDYVEILRGGNIAGLVMASISIVGESATAGEDFSEQDKLVRFGDLSNAPRALTDFIIDDEEAEDAETLRLELHSPQGCVEIGPNATALVTILPSDPSSGRVVFTSDNFDVDESAGVASIEIERIESTFSTANVTVSTADGTGIAGSDYGAVSTQVIFQDGEAGPLTVDVPIIDNTSVDGERTLQLSITSPFDELVGEPSSATLTIYDDDLANGGMLSLGQATYSVDENGGSITATVTRTLGSAGGVSVTLSTADGNALAPGDYTSMAEGVSFADGDTTAKSVNIPIIDDVEEEGDETFYVQLSNPSPGARLGEVVSASVLIVDDDGGRHLFPRPQYWE